jgi:hypothetical protein
VLDEDTNRLGGVVDQIGRRCRRRKGEVLAPHLDADVMREPPAAPSREGAGGAQNYRRAGRESGDLLGRELASSA